MGELTAAGLLVAQQWEYLIIDESDGTQPDLASLNEMGSWGWELATIRPNDLLMGGASWIFKRITWQPARHVIPPPISVNAGEKDGTTPESGPPGSG